MKTANLKFKTVAIVGDSHAQNIAGLLIGRLGEGVRVMGECKLGAGLLHITPITYSQQLTDNCVIIAGTKDAA